jgi:hypothetical protein
MTVTHLAAKAEMRELTYFLKLPGVSRAEPLAPPVETDEAAE